MLPNLVDFFLLLKGNHLNNLYLWLNMRRSSLVKTKMKCWFSLQKIRVKIQNIPSFIRQNCRVQFLDPLRIYFQLPLPTLIGKTPNIFNQGCRWKEITAQKTELYNSAIRNFELGCEGGLMKKKLYFTGKNQSLLTYLREEFWWNPNRKSKKWIIFNSYA